MKSHRRLPSPALIVSIFALVVALGGTAVAATVITKSSQIKNGVITGGDIKNNSLKGADIKDKSITSKDLSSGVAGALQATEVRALEAFRPDGPKNVTTDQPTRIATMENVPPGVYVIQAKAVVAPVDGPDLLESKTATSASCKLDAGGATDTSFGFFSANAAIAPQGIHTQLTRTFDSTGRVTLDCMSALDWNASNSSIIAIKVAAAPRTQVDG